MCSGRLLLIWLCLALSSAAFSQDKDSTLISPAPVSGRKPVIAPQDTSKAANKSVVVKDSARLALERLPKVAIRRSAMLPGWGQVTNGRWWKVPIIYGGFVGLGLAVDFNQRYYKESLDELRYRDSTNGKRLNPKYIRGDNAALIRYKDYYRRNRDLSVLAIAGLYAINIIDAYVDAKFFRFDISDKLGFKVTPSMSPVYATTGLSLTPSIKIHLAL